MISQRWPHRSLLRPNRGAHMEQQDASYDLLVVGGRLAIAIATEAVRLGARVVVGLEPCAIGHQQQGAWARRAMIRLGGKSRPTGRDFFEQWSSEQRHSSEMQTGEASLGALRETATVVEGGAVFTGKNSCALHGREIRFEKAIIAPTCVPDVPAISGLESVGFVTESDWHALGKVPHRVAVLGSSDAACEFAQAFARAGAETHLIPCGAPLLEPFNATAVQLVVDSLATDGVRVHQTGECLAAESIGRMKALTLVQGDQRRKVFVDEILVATGRTTTTERMGLGIAGVKANAGSIVTDARLRTANYRIFAVDTARVDLCNTASVASTCVRNALLAGQLSADHGITTRFVLTQPQLAMVVRQSPGAGKELGDTEILRGSAELLGPGPASVESFQAELAVARNTGRIVGATLVGEQAADLAVSFALGMQRGATLRMLSMLPMPDTTGAQVLQQIGRQYLEARTSDAQRITRWRRAKRPAGLVPAGQ